jgi:hypothetical protein
MRSGFGATDRGQGGKPVATNRYFCAQIGQRDHAGRDQLVGSSHIVKPARDQIRGQGGFSGHTFQSFEQLQLARAQFFAALIFFVGRVGVQVQASDTSASLQPSRFCSAMNSSRLGCVAGGVQQRDAQANQPPGRLSATPSHHAHGVDGLGVGGLGFMAVLDAQIPFGAGLHIEAFRERA